MIVHQLKTWPTYFRPVWDGDKTFEIRYDDRGFQRGDMVSLREWDRDRTCDCEGRNHVDDCARYTGRCVLAEIGYVVASTPPRGQQRGFHGDGYLVLSLINLERIHADLFDSGGEFAAVAGTPTPAVMPQRIPPPRSP